MKEGEKEGEREGERGREGGREGGRGGRERGRERGRGREGVLSCYPSLSRGHSELMKVGRGVKGSERGKRVKF